MESKHVNCENSHHQWLQKSFPVTLKDEYSGVSVVQCLQLTPQLLFYIGHECCCIVHHLQFNIKYGDLDEDTVKMRDWLVLPKQLTLGQLL